MHTPGKGAVDFAAHSGGLLQTGLLYDESPMSWVIFSRLYGIANRFLEHMLYIVSQQITGAMRNREEPDRIQFISRI